MKIFITTVRRAVKLVMAPVGLAMFLTVGTQVVAAEDQQDKPSEEPQSDASETIVVDTQQSQSNASQTAAVDPRTNDQVIVVTGSRIRRENETAAIPVQTLTRDDIQEYGTVDVGEILAEIPGVEQELSPESTSLSTQNNGLSTVNLRRLGGNRTLTLLDGRRAISNSGNGERVSLQTIPAGFVDRVEVTTGGASAIYGTDAIGGVANIILRDDWVGFEVSGRASEADASGEEENTLDITWGTEFNSGRGYALFAISYEDEGEILADSSRPKSIANLEFNEPEDDVFGNEQSFGSCDDTGRFCFNPSGSSNLPGGLFEGDDAWNIGGVWFNDQSLLPNDGRTASDAFETDVDGFNFRPGRTLSPEVETLAVGLKGQYDLSQYMNLFVDLNYSRVESERRNAAGNARNTTDIGVNNSEGDIGSIASDHPFIPPEVEETRSGSVSWRRRFVEVGENRRVNDRETVRFAAGLEGLTDNAWAWSAHASYGRFEQNQDYINELNYLHIRNALNIESDGAGGFQCDDADARANGCVPLNIFGEGAISTAAADYIRYRGKLEQEREQTIVAASMDGDLFELASGSVKAAFGFEYRKEEQDTKGDSDNEFELTSVTPIPDIKADFDVTEIYGEIDIPLVEDSVSLQLAARFADYSTVGNVLSYNVGGSWRVNESLRFRTQYSRSQRAPTLTEFFSPARGDFDGLLDPCDGLNPDGTGITLPPGSNADVAVITANCLSEAGIQAFFADPNNAGEAFEFDGSVSGPNAGNEELFEETADTYTFGTIITPEAVPGLSVIFDYYDISVEDAIGSISTQLTADLCYSSTDFPNNRFCDVITRDASSGVVNQVINQQENLNELSVRGYDATINYDFNPEHVPGRFGLNVIYTRYFEDDFTFLGLNGPDTTSALGEIGQSRHEYRARLRWRYEDFLASYSLRYRSGGVDDIDTEEGDPGYYRVGSSTFHNLYLRYRIDSEPRIDIFGGINNIYDEQGPLLPTGLNSGSTRNIVSRLNNAAGREFYLGFRIRFD